MEQISRAGASTKRTVDFRVRSGYLGITSALQRIPVRRMRKPPEEAYSASLRQLQAVQAGRPSATSSNNAEEGGSTTGASRATDRPSAIISPCAEAGGNTTGTDRDAVRPSSTSSTYAEVW